MKNDSIVKSIHFTVSVESNDLSLFVLFRPFSQKHICPCSVNKLNIINIEHKSLATSEGYGNDRDLNQSKWDICNFDNNNERNVVSKRCNRSLALIAVVKFACCSIWWAMHGRHM